MSFRIIGLDRDMYAHLFGLPQDALAAHGVERHNVTEKPGAPCRITLEDAEPGEAVLLLSHRHLEVSTPYRQEGPIFVREAAGKSFDDVNHVPSAFAIRTLSVRGFTDVGAMIEADLVEGAHLPALLEAFFANPEIAFIHAHYAKRGCFAGLILRA